MSRFERKAYYNRRASAIMHPAEKLSVIADGMDQAKTNLPHLTGWQKPKVVGIYILSNQIKV